MILKEYMTEFLPVNQTFSNEDEIGGYEIAETITGYSRQTLYQLKSAGELPYMEILLNLTTTFRRKPFIPLCFAIVWY